MSVRDSRQTTACHSLEAASLCFHYSSLLLGMHSVCSGQLLYESMKVEVYLHKIRVNFKPYVSMSCY